MTTLVRQVSSESFKSNHGVDVDCPYCSIGSLGCRPGIELVDSNSAYAIIELLDSTLSYFTYPNQTVMFRCNAFSSQTMAWSISMSQKKWSGMAPKIPVNNSAKYCQMVVSPLQPMWELPIFVEIQDVICPRRFPAQLQAMVIAIISPKYAVPLLVKMVLG